MEIVKGKDCVIYYAGKGKKLKISNQETLYSEIVLDKEDDAIKEVDA